MKLFVLGMSAVVCCAALHVNAAAQVGYETESITKINGQLVEIRRPVRTDDFARSIEAVLKRTRPGETLNYADRAELVKIATELKLPAVKNTCYAVAQSVALKVAATAPAQPPPSSSSAASYLPSRDDTYYSAQPSGNSSQATGGYTPPSTYVPVTNYSNVPVNQDPGYRPLPVTLITYEPEDLCTALGLVNCPDGDRY